MQTSLMAEAELQLQLGFAVLSCKIYAENLPHTFVLQNIRNNRTVAAAQFHFHET